MQALGKLVYGMYLLTAREGERDNGCIVNTVVQVSSQPVRIAVCLFKRNLSHQMVEQSGCFCLSALSCSAPSELIRTFGSRSGRKDDKFGAGTAVREENGVRVVEQGMNMILSAQVERSVDLDDHTLFIARVTDSRVLSDEPTLTYEQYLARGKSGN